MFLVLHKSTIEHAKRNQRHHHHWISSSRYDQACNRKYICRISKISRKSRQSFLPYIQSQLSRAKHLDVIWDEYNANSLKATTESKQGQGARRGIQPSSQIPCNWQQFLWSEENKQELFQFLAAMYMQYPYMKKYKSSKLKARISCVVLRVTTTANTVNLAPCTREEADIRMNLHPSDAIQEGYRKIMLRQYD